MENSGINHLAIVPDGNRRLAKRLMEKPWKGHEWGIEKLYQLMDWCKDYGIKTVTFYALSLENLEKRPEDEKRYLFLLAKREIDSILSDPDHKIHRTRTRLIFFGRLKLLPEDLQSRIAGVMAATRGYEKFTINIAMAYGGRQEIVDAANALAGKLKPGKPITEAMFKKHLYTNGYGDPDLIIRTGGEKRLSNFLPYQSVYSELLFLDCFWPELSKEEFSRAVLDFKERERRFGK